LKYIYRLAFLLLILSAACLPTKAALNCSLISYTIPQVSTILSGDHLAVLEQTDNFVAKCINTSSGLQYGSNQNLSMTVTGVEGLETNCGPIYFDTCQHFACDPSFDVEGYEPATTVTPDSLTITGDSAYITSYSAKTCGVANENIKTIYCPASQCCNPDCPTPPGSCVRCGQSPVVLDLSGKGFQLTSATAGVMFDIVGDGTPIQIAWTAGGADNAFLALPGPDGLVHNGKQLFGNNTPQPSGVTPNGFNALSAYDDNKDGVIDAKDAIFPSLRLWIDANHDGISQPSELHTLLSVGVNSISLKYKNTPKTDQFGNEFRYKARVNPDNPSGTVDRVAYDIFFVTANPVACTVPKTTNKGMLSVGGR
jgi:hypothetical protein